MIHPNIIHLNEQISNHFFATSFIPKGTILLINNFSENDQENNNIGDPVSYIQETIGLDPSHLKNSYKNIDDHIDVNEIKYNCISSPFGFKIAIRDISPNEDIIDKTGPFAISKIKDPGFNLPATNITNSNKEMGFLLKAALIDILKVDQPIFHYLSMEKLEAIVEFLCNPDHFKAKDQLKLDPK